MSLPERTPRGTLIHPEWDRTYVAVVIETERIERRGICGTMTTTGSPCKKTPKEEYGWRCGWHREDRIASAAVSSVATTQKTTALQVTDPKWLQSQFGRCNVCPVRGACLLFCPDDYCKIEEAFFDSFMRECRARGTGDLDDYMVIQAGLAWLRSMRANQTFARLGVVEAENTKISWQAVRESKEYRDIMKELGLTRKERLDQDRRREEDMTKVGRGTPVGTLAEVMSHISTQIEKVTEIKAERITMRIDGKEPAEEEDGADDSKIVSTTSDIQLLENPEKEKKVIKDESRRKTP